MPRGRKWRLGTVRCHGHFKATWCAKWRLRGTDGAQSFFRCRNFRTKTLAWQSFGRDASIPLRLVISPQVRSEGRFMPFCTPQKPSFSAKASPGCSFWRQVNATHSIPARRNLAQELQIAEGQQARSDVRDNRFTRVGRALDRVSPHFEGGDASESVGTEGLGGGWSDDLGDFGVSFLERGRALDLQNPQLALFRKRERDQYGSKECF